MIDPNQSMRSDHENANPQVPQRSASRDVARSQRVGFLAGIR